MSEMVERVAKVVGDYIFGYVDPTDTPNTWASSLGMAREAVEAMREPTQEMEDAGWEQLPDAPDDWSPVAAYQRMIDEALK